MQFDIQVFESQGEIVSFDSFWRMEVNLSYEERVVVGSIHWGRGMECTYNWLKNIWCLYTKVQLAIG